MGDRQRITEDVGVVPHHVEFKALLGPRFPGRQVRGSEAVVDACPIDHQAAQALQQVEDRGFAGAVRPQQQHDPPQAQLEIDQTAEVIGVQAAQHGQDIR